MFNWYDNLKIRQKLYLGFGLIVTFVLVLAGIVYYIERYTFGTVETLLNKDVAISKLSLQSYVVALEAFEAQERYFDFYQEEGFAEARSAYGEDVRENLQQLREYIAEIQNITQQDIVFDVSLISILNAADEYEQLFFETVDLIEERGDESTGAEGVLTEKTDALDHLLETINLQTLTIDLFEIRQDEKDYFLGKIEDEKLHEDLAIFRQDVESSELTEQTKTNLLNMINEYEDAFDHFVEINQKINNNLILVKELLESLDEPIDLLFDKSVEAQIAQQILLETTLDNALMGVGILGVLSIVLGLGISRNISNYVSSGIQEAVEVANMISRGELNRSLALNNQDELGEMAQAFNQMVRYQQGMAQTAKQLAQGNVQAEIKPLSNQDVLGVAFAEMLAYQKNMAHAADQVAQGNLAIDVTPAADHDMLGLAFQKMVVSLNNLTEENKKQIWLANGKAAVNDLLRGQQEVNELAQNVIRQLCQYVNSPIGAIYLAEEDKNYHLVGSYAYFQRKNLSNYFRPGDGLVGQCVLEKAPILVSHVPDDYIKVNSGLGEASPRTLLVVPLMYENKVMGVVELGFLHSWDETILALFTSVTENVAIAINSAQARTQLNQLLLQTQQQTEALQVQQEELRVTNEKLSEQAERLRASENRLQQQQAVLEETNAELEENATALKEKQMAVDLQNQALTMAKAELEQRSEELALASKYKSEFLANMSHELRTPLNSMLILARMLTENKNNTFQPDEIEAAQIIYKGGQDLLSLINEILDLAKVEAGKISFHIEPVLIQDLTSSLEAQFVPIADQKGLQFKVEKEVAVPQSIQTDSKRLLQILKNLLSNALKFTTQGSVTVHIGLPKAHEIPAFLSLQAGQAIVFQVRDTGIGIPADKQALIFEAFQQADGSTSRQYGGTGLGLSISRELAQRLGGYIGLKSEVGKGSTFTLYLPFIAPQELSEEHPVSLASTPAVVSVPRPVVSKPEPQPLPKLPPSPTFTDDRQGFRPGEKALLVIEDDQSFAKVLFNFAHSHQFKCLVAPTGEEGLELAGSFQPAAIILDINLPNMNGWEILELLKQNPDTRHIPVHIMSVHDTTDLDAYKRGAMGYLTKPVSQEELETSFQAIEKFITRKVNRVLLVEDDVQLSYSVKRLLEGNDVSITGCSTGREALELLTKEPFDCMILDLSLPDMTGFEVLNQLHEQKQAYCPVIVYTGRELSREETSQLMKYADSVIVKGVKSPERLLDETALFLHRVVADMPAEKQQTIREMYNKESHLQGKKILIVDDDMRNSFALSKLLSDKGLMVEIASDGQKALHLLDTIPDINLVLMDVMMPVMDGLETMRHIRQNPQFTQLPIIALTAKAMPGDRENCISAGANDYLSKPVDVDRLFSLLRVWLYQ